MDATEQQRERLLEEIRTLPADVLQEVSNLIERIQQKAGNAQDSVEETSGAESLSDKKGANPYQELKEFGLIGFAKDGPTDLSVNYRDYLKEGFGSNRDHR
jgi:hypothetical protein